LAPWVLEALQGKTNFFRTLNEGSGCPTVCRREGQELLLLFLGGGDPTWKGGVGVVYDDKGIPGGLCWEVLYVEGVVQGEKGGKSADTEKVAPDFPDKELLERTSPGLRLFPSADTKRGERGGRAGSTARWKKKKHSTRGTSWVENLFQERGKGKRYEDKRVPRETLTHEDCSKKKGVGVREGALCREGGIDRVGGEH